MKTIYIDNSTLEILSKCDLAAIMSVRHQLGNPHESAPLVAGNAVHAALALHLSGATIKDAMVAFDTIYYERGMEELPSDRMYYWNVRDILERWLEVTPLSDWPFTPVVSGIEQPLSAPLYYDTDFGTQVIFVGLLDAPVRDKRDNHLAILDHKTTGRVFDDWKSDFHLKSQIDGYLWLAQQTWPEEDVNKIYINAIELSKIPNSNRKCKQHGTAFSECGWLHPKHELFWVKRTEEQIAGWKRSAEGLIHKYLALLDAGYGYSYNQLALISQQGRFNGACHFCNFKLFCEQSQPINMIDSLFVHKPWQSLLEEKVKAYASRNQNPSIESALIVS